MALCLILMGDEMEPRHIQSLLDNDVSENPVTRAIALLECALGAWSCCRHGLFKQQQDLTVVDQGGEARYVPSVW
jgi:hypothetical protein